MWDEQQIKGQNETEQVLGDKDVLLESGVGCAQRQKTVKLSKVEQNFLPQ